MKVEIEAPDEFAGALMGDLNSRRGRVQGMESKGRSTVVTSLLVAYIPFTHMAHFIAKYFTWHAVRWDDRRNERGSAMEGKVAASLDYKPTWSAPHVGADGQRTWAEIATTNPTREARK